MKFNFKKIRQWVVLIIGIILIIVSVIIMFNGLKIEDKIDLEIPTLNNAYEEIIEVMEEYDLDWYNIDITRYRRGDIEIDIMLSLDNVNYTFKAESKKSNMKKQLEEIENKMKIIIDIMK